jgi:L-lactate utilization protein LutC
MSATTEASNPTAALPAEPAPNPVYARLATEEQIQRTVAALEQNGIKTIIVESRPAAVKAILDLIPAGSSVLDAPSQTLLALGVPEALAAAGFPSLRSELMRLRQENKLSEMRQHGASPDVVVGSVHALTENGQAVIASASGSQLGPYVSGAGKVIWVVGTQKIVPDLDTAFRRIQEYTYPLENERAKKAYGRGSFVSKLLVVNREFQPGRVTVVLLRENLGF